jgi:anhydro-N-acetylmuramic acid kinase
MLDMLVQARGAGRYDAGGRYASVGRVDEGIVRALLAHPYFEAPPPKSLDRHDFSLEPLAALQLEDACATLVAFTAEAVKLGLDRIGQTPREVIVTGGGRLNPELMKAFAARLAMPVKAAEDVDWRGDAIEAEAIAYLAARTARGLPISFPATTGVRAPLAGGRIVQP